jgi:transcriptional regulator with XRE-family HTH domain
MISFPRVQGIPMNACAPQARGQYFSDFATALRYWRNKRGYSQLRLSAESQISQRHISFLESNRSRPSREMVINVMLQAAGFAAAYHERNLSDPELKAVKQALDFMLEQQLPYPALVVDRLWNLVMANSAATTMMKWLLDMPPEMPIPSEGVNVLKLMLDPAGARRHVLNWEDVSADLVHWIQREAVSDGPGSEAAQLLEELVAFPGVKAATGTVNLETRALPFLPVSIRKDTVELNMFTTIATLGTPHDVTVHELRVESYFPADEASAAWFRSGMAAPDSRRSA